MPTEEQNDKMMELTSELQTLDMSFAYNLNKMHTSSAEEREAYKQIAMQACKSMAGVWNDIADEIKTH